MLYLSNACLTKVIGVEHTDEFCYQKDIVAVHAF